MNRYLILTTLLILTACAAPAITAAPSNTPEPPPSPMVATNTPAPSTHSPLPAELSQMPTPDLSLTSAPAEQFSFPFMVINRWGSPIPDTLLLYDLSTGGVRHIKFDDYYYAPLARGWADNGCQIIISGVRRFGEDSWVYEIALTDLQGNEKTPIFTSEPETFIGEGEGEQELYESLSPSTDYLAYLVGSGECIGMVPICEFQRAYIMSSQQHDSIPVELTSNANVMYLEWSPTGEQLAFTDNDEKGQIGLYVIKPDNTEKIHIIDLTRPMVTYWTQEQGLLWSPQGDTIAVVDWIEQSPKEYKYVIRIVSPTGGELHQIPVEVPPLLVSWSEDGRQIVFRTDRRFTDDQQPQVFWLDITSGEVVHILRDDDVEEEYDILEVASINYAEDLLLTMDETTSAYLYNRTTQSLIPVSSRPIFESIGSDILVSPPDFPGEENCPTTP